MPLLLVQRFVTAIGLITICGGCADFDWGGGQSGAEITSEGSCTEVSRDLVSPGSSEDVPVTIDELGAFAGSWVGTLEDEQEEQTLELFIELGDRAWWIYSDNERRGSTCAVNAAIEVFLILDTPETSEVVTGQLRGVDSGNALVTGHSSGLMINGKLAPDSGSGWLTVNGVSQAWRLVPEGS